MNIMKFTEKDFIKKIMRLPIIIIIKINKDYTCIFIKYNQ